MPRCFSRADWYPRYSEGRLVAAWQGDAKEEYIDTLDRIWTIFKSSSKTPKKNGPTCRSQDPKLAVARAVTEKDRSAQMADEPMSSSRRTARRARQNPRQKPPSSRSTPFEQQGHQHQKTPCNLVKETPPTRLLVGGDLQIVVCITTPTGLLASDSAT